MGRRSSCPFHFSIVSFPFGYFGYRFVGFSLFVGKCNSELLTQELGTDIFRIVIEMKIIAVGKIGYIFWQLE